VRLLRTASSEVDEAQRNRERGAIVTFLYACRSCGNGFETYTAQCPDCQAWNTLRDANGSQVLGPFSFPLSDPTPPIRSIPSTALATEPAPRTRGHAAVDRVLGGGFAHAALYLLTGRPGIGKSTLSLQAGSAIAASGRKVLLVATEETNEQIAERARRIQAAHEHLHLFPSTDLAEVEAEIDALKPALVIVDSVKYLRDKGVSARAGSPLQMLAVGLALQERAKVAKFSALFLGHIIKSGDAAGPKELEHLVDCTMTFDIDPMLDIEASVSVGDEVIRVLSTGKNRFGALASARFQMTALGLVEVGLSEEESSE
jgi:DNA repair protein RadA/Sms